MDVITKKQLISTVADRFKNEGFFEAGWRSSRFFERLGTSPQRVHEQLVKLGNDVTEEQVTEIIGDDAWTVNRCDECKQDAGLAVQFGEPPSYDSVTAKICIECLCKAINLCTAVDI